MGDAAASAGTTLRRGELVVVDADSVRESDEERET